MHLRAILKNVFNSSNLLIVHDLIIYSITPLCSCVECRGNKPHSIQADSLDTYNKRIAVDSSLPLTQTSILCVVTIAIILRNQRTAP